MCQHINLCQISKCVNMSTVAIVKKCLSKIVSTQVYKKCQYIKILTYVNVSTYQLMSMCQSVSICQKVSTYKYFS